MDSSARSSVSSVQYHEPSFSGSEIVLQILRDPGRDTEKNPHFWPQSGCLWNRFIKNSGPRSSLLPHFSVGVQGWRWDQGLEDLLRRRGSLGMGSRAGPSRWGFWRGRILWSQKPGAAQEFWLGLHFLGSGGRDPGEAATDTQAVLGWLLVMQPLLCALAGLALLGVEAGEWDQGPRDTPGRRGRNERGTGDRDTGRREGKERRW